LRRQGEAEGWTFIVAENDATRRPLSELCGLVKPADWPEEKGGQDPGLRGPGRDLPSSFDWRANNGCTPIKDQDGCGSCWAFSAVGAVESAILINDGLTVDLSEQWLVSCTTAGSCNGGWPSAALGFMRRDGMGDQCGDSGAVLESDFPYVAWDAPCGCPYPHPYYIDDSRPAGAGSPPNVDVLKQVILDYGPVSVVVYVNWAFQGYSGGVFNACQNGTPNHAVVLVGWDDNQGPDGIWFLRNSWGTGWGEDGYMRIIYGCSRVGNNACKVIYRFDCNDNGIRDDWDIADCDGSPWCSDCNENYVPDECDIAEGDSYDCNGNGVPDECDLGGSPTVYVDAAATGANTGANWTDALTSLDVAFCYVQHDPSISDIWMAKGTYKAAGAGGDRLASLQLMNGVALRGGFAGTESSPEQRDLSNPANWTILSGDLNSDDAPGFINVEDNSYHVVNGSGVDDTAALDGFVIMGGNADGPSPHDTGGGIYVYEGSPTLINCRLLGNRAQYGGGAMHNEGHTYGSNHPALINCLLSGNESGLYAGAVYNVGTLLGAVVPTFTNCSIVGNSADLTGGVYNVHNCAPTLVNCLVWGNRDSTGDPGFAQIYGGQSAVNYCCIQGLSSGLGGTGNIDSDPVLVDADGPDDVPGTPDDNVRLSPCSPCIDAADNSSVPADLLTDLDSNPRFVDDPYVPDTGYPPASPPIVDMGAYEFQGIECYGDLTGDRVIDLADLGQMLANYGATSGALYTDGDLDCNGTVDLSDLGAMLAVYGTICE
jgi:hypothetical protein